MDKYLETLDINIDVIDLNNYVIITYVISTILIE